MQNPKTNLDPSARLTVVLALLLGLAWSAVVVVHPFFIDHLELKLADAIVATAPEVASSNQVVVVDIDERSLATWGQWPWPRTRLACLLEKLKALGAKSIALDFVMAEPDRTSRSTASRDGANDTSACAPDVMGPKAPDNDAVLAATLATGPFVLGYGFDFEGNAASATACHLPALELVNIRQPAFQADGIHFYEAKGIICNIPQLAVSAPHAGFLNGQPDGDGLLRRLPLIITYNGSYYPNLALAALMATEPHEPLAIWQRQGEQHRLFFGSHTIPMDENGNLLIHFTQDPVRLHHFPATQVLADQLSARAVRDRIVLVGLSAFGLTPAYQTPRGNHVAAVDVHAQAVETILSGSTVRRYAGMVYAEILLALLVASLYGLCIARLEFLSTIMVGAAGLLAMGVGTHVLFVSHRILVLPLLPGVVIISGGLLLTLFKYWIRQRRAGQQLRNALVLIKNNERYLNAIIQTIPDIVFRLDETGCITFISPSITRYQRDPEELIGRHILDLVNPEDKAEAAFRINERRTGSRATRDMELRLLLSPEGDANAHGGRYFSISAEGIYAHANTGQPLFAGTQGIAKDIDERRHLERRLEHSKKMEAIGSLAAGVAHDLNNILSGLVSYPELLLMDLPADSPMRGKIETIQRSGQRAADIVQDLLMIARRGVKDHLVISLNHIVKSFLDTPECKRLLEKQANLRITTDLADDLINIRGSNLHILKMIMNLVGNAAEAMPTGGSITLKTRNRYLDMEVDRYERIAEGEYAVLRVADEGIGIATDDLHRIFEPFFSKKRMGHSGSGLGMTVVWNTIKDHGGFVDIQSREGDGTRFDIYLPATREELGKAAERAVLQDYTGSETLLVVDDVPEQRDIAVRMLGKLGYRVTAVESGEAAVDYLHVHTVDLLVLDMVMPPGMDGLATYQRILKIRPAQRAIIASGYAPSDRVKAMQELGAGGYLRKPYTLEKIGLAVRQELDRP